MISASTKAKPGVAPHGARAPAPPRPTAPAPPRPTAPPPPAPRQADARPERWTSVAKNRLAPVALTTRAASDGASS